jgi:hypothetical protein
VIIQPNLATLRVAELAVQHHLPTVSLSRILVLSGAGKQGINARGIQEPLQDRSGHHTDRTLLDEWGKDGVQQHDRYLQARYRGSLR